MLIVTETPRQRALEALESLGREFGVSEDVRAVEGAEDWQPLAVAMVCEAVAALLIEIRPKPGAATLSRRRG